MPREFVISTGSLWEFVKLRLDMRSIGSAAAIFCSWCHVDKSCIMQGSAFACMYAVTMSQNSRKLRQPDLVLVPLLFQDLSNRC